MNQIAIIPEHEKRPQPFVALRIGEQLFGLAVMAVRDVMRTPALTPIPLAPPVIAGLMNVRGKIVTVIDMRARIGLPPRAADAPPPMLVVVEHQQERFALAVDAIVEVLALPAERAEEVPPTMNRQWRDIAANIYTLEKELLVILNIANIVDHAVPPAEAKRA